LLPRAEHLVQFYPSETGLLDPLVKYIAEGLRGNETCIVIATAEHRKHISTELNRLGIDIIQAKKNGQYVAFDASAVLCALTKNGSLREAKFRRLIGEVFDTAMERKQPIRAFGEMVALLWDQGKRREMLALEKYWNKLADEYPMSLYCAYPELHFMMDRDVAAEIRNCHTLTVSYN
jgi:hypothetical protein